MTYKKIVKNMVEIAAAKWVATLLDDNNIDYRYRKSGKVTLENDKEADTILWDVEICIVLPNYEEITVNVGGTVDDLCGICKSVINLNEKIIWMSRSEARETLGITEFKLFETTEEDDEIGFTEAERTEKHTFLVHYDNLVTDDLIEEVLEDMTLEEADNIAQDHSRQTGLSAGNFDMYVYVETEDLEGWVDVYDYYEDKPAMTDEDIEQHMLEVADRLFGKDNSIRERLEQIKRDEIRKAVCDLAAADTDNYNAILDIVSEWNYASNMPIEVYEIYNETDDVIGFGIEDDTFYYAQ